MGMRLRTAENDRVEVERDGQQAILRIWTREKPVRTVKMYKTELEWLIKRLITCKIKLEKSKTTCATGRDSGETLDFQRVHLMD